jgi:hypothetical protein
MQTDVAGVNAVDCPGIENIDLSKIVEKVMTHSVVV